MIDQTKIQVKVSSKRHRQFADLAGFLNPGLKRTDARDKLLDEVMAERIEKEGKGTV